MSEIKCTYPLTNSWEGDQAILRIQRLQKKKNKLKDTSTKEVTNQNDPRSVKKRRGNSSRYMHKVEFTFQSSVHNMESSLPPRNFEHKNMQESKDKRKEAINLAT